MKKRFVSLLALSLMAALLPMSPAAAAPTIELINPSPYLLTQQSPEVSDEGGIPLHIVAWVGDIPVAPLVEFEIRALQNPLPGQNVATIDATRVGNDTWEAFYTIPDSFTDGQYTIDARLFSQLDEVDNDSQTVTVNHSDTIPPPASETAELVRPTNGGQIGFFTPVGKATNTVLEVVTSPGARQVRALYTTTSPGTQPEWKQCGTASVSDSAATVRCTLAQADSAGAVTAVAAVANQTPVPAPPDPAADDAGDAHRVFPYMQVPGFITLDPESVTQESGECQLMTARLADQFGRPIAAANLDVHAEGPNDQLTFATDDTAGLIVRTSDYQAPDSGHVSREDTIRCEDPSMTSGDEQGVHRTPAGIGDRQHIESVGGTSNTGSFVFALYSASSGPTNVTVWADVNDDDSQGVSEVTGLGSIGWDQDPPPPSRQMFIDPDGATAETGTCQTLTVVAREGGSPLIGVNIDVHLRGPDASVTFCDPPGATPRRLPDSGGHLGDAHTDGTKHAEGETDSTGRFLFGVTSVSDGRSQVLAWIDESDDDEFAPSEPSAPATVTFEAEGDRSISLSAAQGRVRKGRKARLSGEINGSDRCSAGQRVRLKARRPGGRFRVIASKLTQEDGSYTFRPKVRRTKEYRSLAPRSGVCEKAQSRIVKVRARR